METIYRSDAPARQELDVLAGATVLEFGTNWCGHCMASQAPLAQALAAASETPLQHFKIEDGPGRPLGRSYRVKLWPTLIFLQDGKELARLVRPLQAEPIAEALAQMVR
jgi:thioredoxin 1